MTSPKTLATSKIANGYRISISKEVADRLGVDVGDFVVIVDDGRGNIVLKKAQ